MDAVSGIWYDVSFGIRAGVGIGLGGGGAGKGLGGGGV